MILALTGGFLGSGKTTAIANACKELVDKGMKVAVITNDQGNQQVDSAFVKAMSVLVKEVSDGCFCCQYNELESHLDNLVESEHPDIIFAESVGSCTDLIATIVKPLLQRRPELKVVVSIFADAAYVNALIEGVELFEEESIRYIYKKQMEEAGLLVINKTDLVTPIQLENVDLVLGTEYPGKFIIHLNSLQDVSTWINAIESYRKFIPDDSLDIDYAVYGEGESKLAWLDKSIVIQAPLGDGAYLARTIIRSIFDQFQIRNFKIGHLKFFVDGGSWSDKFSFTAMSTSGEVRIRQENVYQLRMLINARIQADPNMLRDLVNEVIDIVAKTNRCIINSMNEVAFRPGYPVPVYRME